MVYRGRSSNRVEGKDPRLVAVALAAVVYGIGCSAFIGDSTSNGAECGSTTQTPPGIGVLWSPDGGTCAATLIGRGSAITAASCVQSEPVITVFGERQYIADRVVIHPAWAGGQGTDLAVIIFDEEVSDMPRMSLLQGAVPAFGDRVAIFGFARWLPQGADAPELQAAEVSVGGDINDSAFGYVGQIDEECIAGRAGAPVITASSGILVGIHGTATTVNRIDEHACWLACASGETPTGGMPAGCDCDATTWRPCGACGAEYYDAASGQWGTCTGAPERRPCDTGFTCASDGSCQPDGCAEGCADAFGEIVCPGDTGYRQCPMEPEGVQQCTCSASNTWISCTPGCLL